MNNKYLSCVAVGMNLEEDILVLSKQLSRTILRFARLVNAGEYIIIDDLKTGSSRVEKRTRWAQGLGFRVSSGRLDAKRRWSGAAGAYIRKGGQLEGL